MKKILAIAAIGVLAAACGKKGPPLAPLNLAPNAPSPLTARRLHTVMEKLLDNVSFDAPDLVEKELTIDAAYVDRMLSEIARNEDLSRYIL